MSTRLLLVCMLINSFTYADSAWKNPNRDLRYDQVCYATAHNAFSSKNEGWKMYYQQVKSISEQLNLGVRCFMLDTYDYNGKIVLCHGSCAGGAAIQRGIGQGIKGIFNKEISYKTYKETMDYIVEWLKQHPEEVVTIFLENYVDHKKLVQETNTIKDIRKVLLTPQAWNPKQDNHNGYWPTLDWMIKNNKRLIIFVDRQALDIKNDPFFPTWNYVIESQYSTLNQEKACVDRDESKRASGLNRKLVLINYFASVTSGQSPSRSYNSSASLKKLINTCKKQGFAKGKEPNFIALDNIHEGNVIQVCNEINEVAAQGVK